MRPETEPWWKQAQADLQSAELTLRGGQFYAVSWFAQQAAEKELKALYLESLGKLPPRTHNLVLLGAEVGAPESVENDLLLLNPAFGMARYPNPAGTPPVDAVGIDDARDHLAAARRTVAWVRNELGLTPPPIQS